MEDGGAESAMKDNRAAATTPTTREPYRRRLIAVGTRRGHLRLTGRVTSRTTTSVPPTEPSESTPYLCAAAHLDETFPARALRSTIRQRHRAIAPSLGVDLVQVVKHCLVADRRQLIRDICPTTLLLDDITQRDPRWTEILIGRRGLTAGCALSFDGRGEWWRRRSALW
jgi:hypothetical protein